MFMVFYIQTPIRVAAVIGICTLSYSVEQIKQIFRYLLRSITPDIKPSIDHGVGCHGTTTVTMRLVAATVAWSMRFIAMALI